MRSNTFKKKKPHLSTSRKQGNSPDAPSQLELGLQKDIERLQSSVGSPVFLVNELFEIVAFANGARSILGAPHARTFALSDCEALSVQQIAKLRDLITQLLVEENTEDQLFHRCEIEVEKETRTFCFSLQKDQLNSGEKCVRCLAESIIPHKSAETSVSISSRANARSVGWTLDTDSRAFDYCDNEPSQKDTPLSLSDWLACVLETDRQDVAAMFYRLLEGESSVERTQYRVTLPDGKLHTVDTVARAVPEPDGGLPSTLIGMHQYERDDNQALIEDLKLFSHLARKVQLSILVYDHQGNISWCNNAFTESTGYELNEIAGRDPHSLLRGPMTELDTLNRMRERISKGKAFHTELVQYKKNGAPYWVSIDGNPLIDEHGNCTRFISFQSDITESKKTQSAILRNEIKFRSLFDNSIDALLLISPRDGVIIEANSSAIQLLDTDRLVGQRLEEIFPKNEVFSIEHLNELIDSAEGSRREAGEFLTARGHVRPVELTVSRTPIGESIALFVTLRDISEKRLLEEQLRHTQRMEAVGRLAGGIAHDFNNLLAGQKGFSELLCASRELSKKNQAYANEILKITDRASKLTSRLLSFSRGKSDKPVVANLNDAIDNMMPMLSRILKTNIKFTSQLDPHLSNVKVDTNQIDQVIMNLVVNGQEAITSNDGLVKLETTMVDLDGSEIFITGRCKPGRYVKVAVQDNGLGIHHEVLEKIFEPFFTTKKGAGTGLGLSIVYGIIQSNGGHLMVDSAIGSGTEFAFYFPEVLEKVEQVEATDPQRRMPSASQSEEGEVPTILIAEDQEQVREILELGLGQSGYQLIVAKDGQQAIDKGMQHSGKIDLILSDSIMPGASGCKVVETLREKYPNSKVVIMSGLPQQESEECQGLEVDAYVDKPFSIRKLLELIEELVAVAK